MTLGRCVGKPFWPSSMSASFHFYIRSISAQRAVLLIIDYMIAVCITRSCLARAFAMGSMGLFLKKPMTWIDFAILATLLFPNALFNFAFLRAMRLWAVGESPLFAVI